MVLQMYGVSVMLCLQCDHVNLMFMFHMNDATRVHSGDQQSSAGTEAIVLTSPQPIFSRSFLAEQHV